MHLPVLAGGLLCAAFTAAIPHETRHASLFHRIFHPTALEFAYRQRGSLALSPDGIAFFFPADSLSDDLAQFAAQYDALDDRASKAVYQVALQHPGDVSEALWDVSSVNICHLAGATEETIFLHSNGPDTLPYALDYFVSPLPHNGVCPKANSSRKSRAAGIPDLSPFQIFAERYPLVNTTVSIRLPSSAPSPVLQQPLPLTPDGQVAKPPPQKSFIEKYWVYIVGLMLMLVLSGGAEEQPKDK